MTLRANKRTSIWLVRHGQTEHNKARRYLGAADSPLTFYGLQQHRALARRLQRIPFTHAFVSPCNRTRAAAQLILEGRTVAISEDHSWAETNHGNWEGLTYREVCARFPADAAARFSDPLQGRARGGESLAEVAQRIARGWEALLAHPGGRILVVSHATPIQLVLCLVTGMPPTMYWRWRVDLGSLTVLDMYSGGPIVRMVNEIPRIGTS